MVRQNKIGLDIQKKAYHTDKFYQPKQTPKASLLGSPYEVILNHLSYEHKICESYIELGTAVFWIQKIDLLPIMKILKKLGYEILSEMSAIDMLDIKGEFEMFYQLLSCDNNNIEKKRIRVKCVLSPNENIDSIVSEFRCAIWSEREAFDMFGIIFNGHPHLTRLLMPQDWVGHPLLKSYPLKGDESASWYEVDRIFGKEYRQIIGPEQRDSARVDEKDTFNFARIGHEMQKGSQDQSVLIDKKSSKALFVKKLDLSKAKVLKERR
ncbi:NADH-quinone oxidoreductase subunit C [Helicobacter cappadocius]|uniref:NADH-quinone oxidoreductase subunit C n=1 Tax=Helicobacter cappadocius TaxID=3063998 RepID=A0AA90PSY6_9HELI|nr:MULTISPECIES: NADH-quinone oxidoreductase subunit C [unclassified Helicobacter]MDO7253705.1 NADH-quinone oxidoreductase subunit C [Helicobacter sp. faydin-H75]MDP2539607.1 NADH-quinone oxidoreductase subunit C [Helicobacter sp. faydin-H76]